MGKISKQILDRVNAKVITGTAKNQWKHTSFVINWFKKIDNKKQHSFICFDIVEFCPSISEELLNKALDFASAYDNITAEERNIVIQAKKSLLTHKQQSWKKKSASIFDVTMSSFDGAEKCELVGCFLLSQLKNKCGGKIGLYGDDGLAVSSATPRGNERIKNDICLVFKEHGLNITIEVNKKIVDFLDVTLDFNDTKPNASLLYVNKESNHPHSFVKNIPAGINRRLSSISSDEKSFDREAPPYQKALDESGYNYRLKFDPPRTGHRRNRERNILWFNPPFSKSVHQHREEILSTRRQVFSSGPHPEQDFPPEHY